MSDKTSDGIMLMKKPSVNFVNRTPSSAGLVTPADASIVSRQGRTRTGSLQRLWPRYLSTRSMG